MSFLLSNFGYNLPTAILLKERREVMLELRIEGREQTRTPIHFELTYEAYNTFKDNMEKAARYTVECDLGKKQVDMNIWERYIKKSMNYFLVQHLFAAMCLESFIYDYAATNFTDTFVRKYLDKLDLVSKWVIVPKLVLGKEYPRYTQAFKYLRNIKKERDKLVHSKSRPELTNEERGKELAKYDLKFGKKSEDKDTDKNVNIFRWLVDILATLKKLEEESGKQQDWWRVVEKDQEKF